MSKEDSRHLHQRPRPVCEALIAVEKGRPLDDVLEDYARIPSSFFSILGAISFAQILRVIKRSSK
jgi:hypothetical protein